MNRHTVTELFVNLLGPQGAPRLLRTTDHWTTKWTWMVPMLALTFLPCAFAQSYWIDRVAGNPSAADDGIPATEASLSNAWDVAVDGSGSLYIADYGNNRIRKVDSAGIITTVAGTGSPGFSGDGGPAANAQLSWPRGVAVDGSGNIYIADYANNRIRKVDSAGIITTVAGTGSRGFSGDGGPAANAQLSWPRGVAVDGSGSLYIAESGNDRIRKVDSTGIITTVAGRGSEGSSGDGGPASNAALRNPNGVAVDGSGSLYIADTFNHRIRKVDSTGIITTVAGTGRYGYSGDGGPAANARLDTPYKVAVDGSGNLYIADTDNHRIRKVDSAGIITTVAGGSQGSGGDCGPASDAELRFPKGIAVDRLGRIVVADGPSVVRRLSVTAPSKCRASPATLSAWTVSRGRVVFGGVSSRGCPTLSEPVNGVSYLVHTSEWQRRAPSATAWATVGGTLRTGRLCAFEPNEPGQYRAVAEISVGSRERAQYRSANAIAGPSVVADTEPSFGTASIRDQSYVSGTAISALTLPTASGGDSPLAYSLDPSVPGLSFDSQARQLTGTPTTSGRYGTPTISGTYFMRFSVRDSDGDTATLRFTITVQSSGGTTGAKRYSAGDRITTLPTGFWTPDVTSGASFQYSGGTATVRLNNGGYIEEGDYRYACESSGGCEVVNGTVTRGVVVESSTGDGEPSSMADDHSDTRSSATSLTPGTPVTGSIDPGDDVDYFRLRLSESTAVAIYTTGSLDTTGTLRDASGNRVDSDDDGGGGSNFRIEATLSAGTHYVEVKSYDSDETGRYTLHVERQASGTETGSTSGGNYTPLDDWTVSSGRVRFLFFSAGRCVRLVDSTINGVTYTIHSSKWQRRAPSASAWVDIPGTEASAAVCSYTPNESGQYRGVAEITIGGTRGSYATKNVLSGP